MERAPCRMKGRRTRRIIDTALGPPSPVSVGAPCFGAPADDGANRAGRGGAPNDLHSIQFAASNGRSPVHRTTGPARVCSLRSVRRVMPDADPAAPMRPQLLGHHVVAGSRTTIPPVRSIDRWSSIRRPRSRRSASAFVVAHFVPSSGDAAIARSDRCAIGVPDRSSGRARRRRPSGPPSGRSPDAGRSAAQG